jgi:hypothetical protein
VATARLPGLMKIVPVQEPVAGQSSEAHVFPVQDNNLAAE